MSHPYLKDNIYDTLYAIVNICKDEECPWSCAMLYIMTALRGGECTEEEVCKDLMLVHLLLGKPNKTIAMMWAKEFEIDYQIALPLARKYMQLGKVAKQE